MIAERGWIFIEHRRHAFFKQKARRKLLNNIHLTNTEYTRTQNIFVCTKPIFMGVRCCWFNPIRAPASKWTIFRRGESWLDWGLKCGSLVEPKMSKHDRHLCARHNNRLLPFTPCSSCSLKLIFQFTMAEAAAGRSARHRSDAWRSYTSKKMMFILCGIQVASSSKKSLILLVCTSGFWFLPAALISRSSGRLPATNLLADAHLLAFERHTKCPSDGWPVPF